MREERLYTLKLWRDGPAPRDWRASLKDVDSKEVRHFESLEALAQHVVKISAPSAVRESRHPK